MLETSIVVHSTFQLQRNLKASPERAFAAFADPAEKGRWFFAGSSHEIAQHQLDFRIGGTERLQMKMGPGTPVSGKTIINDSIYQDIIPAKRIVIAYRMSMDGKPFSASLATIEFLPDGANTNLLLTHQGAYFEGADGPAMRKEGWESLLKKLVAALED